MFASILLPLDGSRRSERALPYAASLAKMFGGQLILVHDETVGLRGDDMPAAADIVGRVSALVGSLDALDVRVRLRVVRGAAAEAIVRAADDEHADSIVMSTHGRRGLDRWLHGSVADDLLRHTGLPLMLIPSGCDRHWFIEGPFRLLVPLDGSELAETALLPAVGIADALRAELLLLRVVEPVDGFAALGASYLSSPPPANQSALHKAQQYLNEISTRPGLAGRKVVARIAVGDPAARIAGGARDEDVDLILMATHGHGGLARLAMGSVATSVLQQATTPLLLTRSAAHQAVAGARQAASTLLAR